MAGVDTRDKRASMIGLAKPYLRLLANPTGTVGQSARQMLEFLYSGILAGSPVISSLVPRLMLIGAGSIVLWVLVR